MNRYKYNDLIIEVIDESTYKFGSTDNTFKYGKCYFGIGEQEYHPTSKHGVKIYKDDQIINSCLIIGSSCATGIHQQSSLIDYNKLLICCSDTVFCLTLTSLNLNWKTQVDPISCFKIFKQQEDYIIHGELQITKLDKQGNIKWEFGGADIFVSIDNEEEFKIESDGILLTDFAKTKYKIDFDGKLIWDSYLE